MRTMILAGLLLASGCLGTPGSSPAEPATINSSHPHGTDGHNATLPPKAWPAALGGPLAGEPSVALGPDLAQYVVAVSRPERANIAWRSLDGGRNWTYLGRVAEEYGSNDADVSVGPDGAVWVATAWSRNPNGREGPWCVAVSRSTDHGERWQTTPNACTYETFTERPWIVAGARGTLLLHGCASTAAWCLGRSSDNQRWQTAPVWTPPGSILSRPIYDRTGGIALAFAAPAPGPDLEYRGLFIARTADGGSTWTIERVADEAVHGRFLQFATDGERELIAWLQGRPSSPTRVMAVQGINGTWSAPITLSHGSAGLPWASGRPGQLLVAWLGNDSAVHPHAAPASAHWSVRLWRNGVVMDTGFVAYEGRLCGAAYTLLQACGRPTIGDFFSADVDGTGGATVAVGSGLSGAVGFNEVPIHAIRVPSTSGPGRADKG